MVDMQERIRLEYQPDLDDLGERIPKLEKKLKRLEEIKRRKVKFKVNQSTKIAKATSGKVKIIPIQTRDLKSKIGYQHWTPKIRDNVRKRQEIKKSQRTTRLQHQRMNSAMQSSKNNKSKNKMHSKNKNSGNSNAGVALDTPSPTIAETIAPTLSPSTAPNDLTTMPTPYGSLDSAEIGASNSIVPPYPTWTPYDDFAILNRKVKRLSNALNCLNTQASSRTQLYLDGCNLYIRNGNPLQQTAQNNGLGNLIIGYNEATNCPAGGCVRTGSHNLVVGMSNAWTSSGGLVAGEANTIQGTSAVITGGFDNIATGLTSTIVGVSMEITTPS